MSPQLIEMLNKIISSELVMHMTILNEMNNCHEEGLQGFKRFHRFYAMKRDRNAIRLSNFIVEFHHYSPNIVVNYSNNAKPTSLISAIQYIYELGKTHIQKLKDTVKVSISEGEDNLVSFLESMIKDQSMDCERYYRLMMDINRPNADLTNISYNLHCKYKHKEEKHYAFTGDEYK